jgi:hypothetical protein
VPDGGLSFCRMASCVFTIQDSNLVDSVSSSINNFIRSVTHSLTVHMIHVCARITDAHDPRVDVFILKKYYEEITPALARACIKRMMNL